MSKRAAGWLLVSACVLPVGCATLDGQWQAVSIEPDPAAATVHFLSFGSNRTFTATYRSRRGVKTVSGRYDVSFGRLVLQPTDGPAERFGFEQRLDGTIRLRDDRTDPPSVVTMKRRESRP